MSNWNLTFRMGAATVALVTTMGATAAVAADEPVMAGPQVDPVTGMLAVRVPQDLCSFSNGLPADLVAKMSERRDFNGLVRHMVRNCPELALGLADSITATTRGEKERIGDDDGEEDRGLSGFDMSDYDDGDNGSDDEWEDDYDAFDDGYDQGYDKGYEDGYDDGYDTGWDDGYDSGYDSGFDDGFDAGFEAGQNSGNGSEEAA